MELAPLQQAAELINRSTNILVCLPVRPSPDAVASSLALYLTLERLGKRVKVVCSEFELPSNHSFLPKSDAIERELKNLRQFIISVDVSRAAVESLSYEINHGKLDIYLTPKSGFFDRDDVTTNAGNFAYDAVVTIGAMDLDGLGAVARDNSEFFYAVPTVNIDHVGANARFGQVNVVDLTASSNAEIVFELIRALGVNVLDDQVATSLLTGIISKTKGFQAPSVTPRSLAVASHLISSGAKREEIIEHLFQSKSLASLKLWGRTLARLQSDLEGRVVWSLLSDQDFEKSGASETDLHGVIDEVISSIPTAEVIIILTGRANAPVWGVAGTTKDYDLRMMFPGSRPVGSHDRLVQWDADTNDLAAAEQTALQLAKSGLNPR